MNSSPDPVLTTLASYEAGAAEYAAHSADRAPSGRLHDIFTRLVGPQALVLDLGAGPGHDAVELARRRIRAIACDPTRGLLASGAHLELTGKLLQSDARMMPLANGSLDGIWACASLLHLPKPRSRQR